MSTLVDERVVEMRFDNRDFEKNTKKSMSTIQKLKSSLNFSGVANSVNQSVNSVDMNPLIAGLEKTKKTFSAWEIFAISAISNISNRLVNLGIETVKSFTIDRVSSGWQQFGEVTRATGTMIAQLTARGISEEDAIKQVNEAMEKFNWYSDITSFSTQQMTDAAAKFISKGKDLKETFEVITAIGNLGASAGKSAEDVAPLFELVAKTGDRVMTPLYDSMYRSGIMTEEFTNKLLESAVAQGILKKSVDTFDKSMSYVYDNANTHLEITSENIRESISQGWLSSEVFFGALKEYGSSVEEIYDLNKKMQEEENLLGTGKQVSGYDAIEEYVKATDDAVKAAQKELEVAKSLGDELAITNAEAKLSAALANQFSAKWTDAATEARTFSEAVNAVRDAIKTEWSNIFTLIIGDYKKAAEVWSTFSDNLYDMFASPIKKIRELIQNDNFVEIQKSLFGGIEENSKEPLGAIWNILNAIQKFIDTVKEAFNEVFPFTTSISSLAEKFRLFTLNLELSEEVTNGIKGIFKGLFSIFKLGIKILQGLKTAIDPVFKALLGESGNLIVFLGKIGDKFSKIVSETNIFIRIGKKVSRVFTTIIDTLKELKIIEKTYNTFKKFFSQFKLSEEAKKLLYSLKTAANNVFEFLLNSLKNVLTFFGNYIIPAVVKTLPYLLGLFGYIAKGISIAVKFIIDSFSKLFEFIKSNETIQNGWTKFIEFMQSIPEKLKSLKPFFDKLGKSIGNFFIIIWEGIKKLGNTIASFFKLNTIGELFAIIGEKIAYGFGKIVEGIRSLSSSDTDAAVSGIKEKLSPLQPLFKGLIDLFKGVWAVLKALLPLIGTILSAVGNLLTQIGNSITKTFNQNISENGGINLWHLINGGIGLLITKGLYDLVYLFNGITSAIANTIDSLGGVMRAKAVIMWAEAIKTVALAILMLVGSILVITLFNPDKLKAAVKTLIAIMATLGLIIAVMGHFLKTDYQKIASMPEIKFGKGKGFNLSGGGATMSGSSFDGVAAMIGAFAASIFAMVVALKIIDSINPDNLAKDLIVLGGLMLLLSVAVGLMNYISNIGSEASKGIKGVKGLVGFGISVLLLVIPLKKLGEMDSDKLSQGLRALAILLISYGATVRLMNGLKAKGINKMAAFAAGIIALVGPIQLLSSLPVEGLMKAIAAVLLLSLTFGALAMMTSDYKFSSAASFIATMITFGFVINALASLINGPISQMSWESMGKYMLISTTVLIFVALLSSIIEKINSRITKVTKVEGPLLKNFASVAIILAALSATIVLLMAMASMMNNVDWSSFGAIVGLFALVLGSTIGALMYASKMNSSKEMIKNVAIMALILGALTTTLLTLAVLTKAISTIKDDPKQLLGLVLASLAVVILGMITLTALSAKLSGSSYKGILAVSLIFSALGGLMLGFAELIKVANGADNETIVNVIKLMGVALLGAIGIIAVASMFESKISVVADTLIKLGQAFVLFGLAVAAFAIGIAILKNNLAGMLMFAVTVLALAAAMKMLSSQQASMYTISALFAAIGVAVLSVGASMMLISIALEKMLPMLDELAVKSSSLQVILNSLMQGVLEGIANALPTIMDKVMTALDILLSWILDKLKSLIDWFMNLDLGDFWKVTGKLVAILMMIITQSLAALSANAYILTGHLIDIMIAIIYALIDRLGNIMQALVDLVIGLIDSFGKALADNAERLRESIINFAKNMWQAFLNFFGIHSPSKESQDAAGNIVAGLVNGLAKGLGSIVKVLVKIGGYMLKEILKLPKKFSKAGAEIFKAFLNGLKSVINTILEFVKWCFDKIYYIFTGNHVFSEYEEAGKQAMVSYTNGMETITEDASVTAKEVISQVADELSKTEYFKEIGKEIVRHLIIGIDAESYELADAVSQMLYTSIESLEDSYEEIEEVMSSTGVDAFVGSLSNAIFGALSVAVNELDAYISGLSKSLDGQFGETYKSTEEWLSLLKKVIDLQFAKIDDATAEGIKKVTATLEALKDLIEEGLQFDDDELTIRPVMDISDIEEKTGQIAGMLYSVGSINVATATMNAEKASSEINAAKQVSEQVSNTTSTQLGKTDEQGGVYNVTFNITGNDPKAIADEVSKRFQQYTSRRNTAYGRGNI